MNKIVERELKYLANEMNKLKIKKDNIEGNEDDN